MCDRKEIADRARSAADTAFAGETTDELNALLQSTDHHEVTAALAALRRPNGRLLRHPGLVLLVMEFLSHDHRLVRPAAAATLSGIGRGLARMPGMADRLVALLADPEPSTCVAALAACRGLRGVIHSHPRLALAAVEAIGQQRPEACAPAREVLGAVNKWLAGHPAAIEALGRRLTASHPDVLDTAVTLLAGAGPALLGYPWIIALLGAAMADTGLPVAPRMSALQALRACGDGVDQASGLAATLVGLYEEEEPESESLRYTAPSLMRLCRGQLEREPGLINQVITRLAPGKTAAAALLSAVPDYLASHPDAAMALVWAPHGAERDGPAIALAAMGERLADVPGLVDALVAEIDGEAGARACNILADLGDRLHTCPRAVVELMRVGLGPRDYRSGAALTALGRMRRHILDHPTLLARYVEDLKAQTPLEVGPQGRQMMGRASGITAMMWAGARPDWGERRYWQEIAFKALAGIGIVLLDHPELAQLVGSTVLWQPVGSASCTDRVFVPACHAIAEAPGGLDRLRLEAANEGSPLRRFAWAVLRVVEPDRLDAGGR